MVKYDCDVLVIGCGAAGLTSALAALENGASVIVLERSPKEDRGGNTRWTEALLRLKGCDPAQPEFAILDDFVDSYAAQAGYHVPPALLHEAARPYEEWSTLLRTLPILDPEVLDAFASNVPATLSWLQGHGMRFHVAQYPMIFSAPLFGIYGGGLALVDTLCPLIESRGANVIYDMTAISFLLDDDLGVKGVKAVHAKESSIEITAGKTILACGGFEGNPAMLAQYMGPNARYTRPVASGGWYNKGEGIRLALDIGATPAGDYAECHRQPIDPRSSVAEALVGAYPLGIVVNALGERFMDEAPSNPLMYLERHCRQINAQPDGIGYFIFDQRIESIHAWRRMLRTDQQPIMADSIEELAGKIGVDPDALKRSISEYNEACGPEDGFSYVRDDAAAQQSYFDGNGFDWTSAFDGLATSGLRPNKSNWARPIDQGPFGCFPIISSTTFTFGGLKVTRDAQVVRTSGAVIPNLYAAGETMGVMFGTYVGATSVLRGVTFGRIAGSHASSTLNRPGQ